MLNIDDEHQSDDEHQIVSHEEWLEARTAFLAKEKELTRRRDELSRERRDLPWEAVTKEYVFVGPDRNETLSELFDGQSQLVVYHFMFVPTWDDGCPHCSFWADSFEGIGVHLKHRDVTLVAVSRAPFAKLAAYKERMGWTFPWVSSSETDFNRDFGVSFTPEEVDAKQAFYNFAVSDPAVTEREGVSVFVKDSHDRIFHTYSAYARGIDMLNAAYSYVDLVPKGRDEAGHDNPQYWVRRHDEY